MRGISTALSLSLCTALPLSLIRVRAYVCACVSVRRFNYSPGEHDSRRLRSIETGRRGGRVGKGEEGRGGEGGGVSQRLPLRADLKEVVRVTLSRAAIRRL